MTQTTIEARRNETLTDGQLASVRRVVELVHYWLRQGNGPVGVLLATGLVVTLSRTANDAERKVFSAAMLSHVTAVVLFPAVGGVVVEGCTHPADCHRALYARRSGATQAEAVKAFRAALKAQYAEEKAVSADPEALFVRALKSHDWSYMMADDSRTYNAGLASEREIDRLAKALPTDRAEALRAQHTPKW